MKACVEEAVAARVDDLQWVEFPADAFEEAVDGWMLRVIGKGQKLRDVPVPTQVIDELRDYLESRGLQRAPECISNRGAHLLGKASDRDQRAPNLATSANFDPRNGIAAATLANQIKAFFTECAVVLQGQGDIKGAERFVLASTHWLRHSHASHAIARGMPIEIAQQNLGHAFLTPIVSQGVQLAEAAKKYAGRILDTLSHERIVDFRRASITLNTLLNWLDAAQAKSSEFGRSNASSSPIIVCPV